MTRLRRLIFGPGIILALFSLLAFKTIYNLAILEIYLVLIIIGSFNQFKQKVKGRIYDRKNRPLESALIRAKGYVSKKIRAVAISDKTGRFTICLKPGWYIFIVKKSGYRKEEKLEKINTSEELGEIEFNLKNSSPEK